MRLLKQLVVVGVVAFAGSALVGAAQWNPVLTLLFGAATAVLTLLAYRWIVRRTEHRAPDEVAAKGAAGAVTRGMLIGFAMFGAVIANIAFLGDYRVDGFGSAGGAVALLGFMAAAAVTEEVMVRGVLFRIVEERTGTWVALVLTALLFGLMHLPNPGADLWSALAIAIEAGGMLAAAYVATRNLWVPIGLHFAWNFAGGGIFGTTVSGKDAPDGLLNSTTSGPTLLGGGEFGPEASLYAVGFGAALMVAFLWLARRRGTIVHRRGRRTAEPAAAATLAR
ncbi:CPBP family intramembrane glutamic endopeptidase [Actinomadura parmotrematis]|uniref:CPBP family intramembrane metalloprotease n=1 Tax=Actinomadura parmotrematis TaxID=2864039 RepID=A0ABS7FU54_9ACTN|nr:CPBP family intramembrane glutamic endopeptidase [Actinomadura parmotrematis]MBW8483935.1 CPBP family intramembrane metalloprotease [Actinomadura parmotrematis]